MQIGSSEKLGRTKYHGCYQAMQKLSLEPSRWKTWEEGGSHLTRMGIISFIAARAADTNNVTCHAQGQRFALVLQNPHKHVAYSMGTPRLAALPTHICLDQHWTPSRLINPGQGARTVNKTAY